MKAYTWKQGHITVGLDTVDDQQLGPVVLLGEGGRGRRYEKIKLDRSLPAKIADDKVLDAELHAMPLPPRSGRPKQDYFTLKKPVRSSQSVIVRVCTRWKAERETHGAWTVSCGTAKEMISGRGAHGEAGRGGSWTDSLLVMEPGAVLQICPEGGHKVQPWALWLDNGVPQTAPWGEYEAATGKHATTKAPVKSSAVAHEPTAPGSDPDETPAEWESAEVASSALDALRAKFAN